MLKISPLVIYDCCSKLLSISESILENYDLLWGKRQNLYHKLRNFCNISDFESIYYEFDFQIQIWQKLVQEIETALGEPMEKIMEADYKEEYIEKKLFDYYVSLTNDNDESNNYKRYLLNEICDFGLEDENYDLKIKAAIIKSKMSEDKLNEIIKTAEVFDYKKFGYSNIEDVIDELVIFCDRDNTSPSLEILMNVSKKGMDYEFNPTETTKSDDYYSCCYRGYPYIVNSEIINVNGYEFDFAQVLPEDYTKFEKIYYDYCKNEVINTMKTLPDNYLKAASLGKSNAIVLTSSHKFMEQRGGDWSGYYGYGGNDTIVIKTPFYGVEYYTEDVVIHEMGHKFEHYNNMRENSNFSISEWNNEWKMYCEKYQYVLPPIVPGSYDSFPNCAEFFAETSVAYFKNPDELKELCPEVYDAFHKMLGYEN